jgi:hypothetical protein
MSSSERVDKYSEDASKLLAEGNAGKICAEVSSPKTSQSVFQFSSRFACLEAA